MSDDVPISERPLTRTERLRRVILLCSHFTRNLAYYRAAMEQVELREHSEFWCTVSGNFIDQSVLEWCKLFSDRKGKHHWKTILKDPPWFQSHMLRYMEIDDTGYAAMSDAIKHYRDTFIAHLDLDRKMFIPELEPAFRAVCFYHRQVLADPAASGHVNNLPQDQRQYLDQCLREAREIYSGRFQFGT